MRKSSFLFLVLALACATLSGCALQVKTPTTRFITSETNGDFGNFSLGGGVGGSSVLEITSNYKTTSPNDVPAEFVRDSDSLFFPASVEPRIDAALSVHDRIDLQLDLQTNQPQLFRAKFQLVGEPRVRRKPMTFSLLTYTGVGYDGTRNSSTSNSTSTSWDVRLRHVLLDLGLVAGFRPSNFFLIYLSGYGSYGRYKGFIETDAPGGVTMDRFDGSLTHVGSTLGLSFDLHDIVSLKLEAAYARLYHVDDDAHRVSGGAMLNFFF